MNILPVLNIKHFPNGNIEDFYANEFTNHIESYHKSIQHPHKHDFYLAILFTEGQGIHEIDFDSFEIKRGSLFMLNPGQTHNWRFSKDTNGYVIFHTKEFYDLSFTNRTVDNFPFFYSLQNSPFLSLNSDELEELVKIFKAILSEYKSGEIFKQEKLCSLVDLLYIEVSRYYAKKSNAVIINDPGNYFVKFRQLERLIDENYLICKSASAYAEMMHMSAKHLNRIVQSVLGKTTSDLIHDRIILEAKRMLVQSDANVSEIAQFLGYEDYSYFSRFFKKKCKITPSEFLEKYSI